MIKRTLLVALLMFLFSASAQALTIDDVIYMSSAGVDDAIIIAKIDASGYVYDLSTEEIVVLWDAGVSPEVIEYMISTAAGEYADDVELRRELDEDGYYDDDDYYDDDYILVHRPRSRVHLYFGLGYYDSWYYPYWWWHRPYYYDWGFYAGYYWPYHHWPSYYYWSPYAYHHGWGCGHWRGCHDGHVRNGFREHWRRGGLASAAYTGRSGYRLKPAYSVGGAKKGGYLARDGRYVFPNEKSRGGYLGVHRGDPKDLASRGYSSKSSGRGGYDRGKYYSGKRTQPVRDGKTTRGTYKRGTVYRTKDVKKGRTYRKGTRTKPTEPGKAQSRKYKRSRAGGSGSAGSKSVRSSRSSGQRSGSATRGYSGSSRSGSRSSGSRSSSGSRGSSGSSRGSSGSRSGRGR